MDEIAARLRRVASRYQRLEAERNALIVEARRSGMPFEKIGGLVGLTHEGVRKIVKRMESGAR